MSTEFLSDGISLPFGAGDQKVLTSDPDGKGTWQYPPGVHYIHTQSSPSATWIIPHGILHFVHVTLINASNEIIHADIADDTSGTTTITFPTPTTGFAYLS